jgi:hypothetical protein
MVVIDHQIHCGVDARLGVKDDHLSGLLAEVELDALQSAGGAQAFRLPDLSSAKRRFLDREVGDGSVKVAFQRGHRFRLAMLPPCAKVRQTLAHRRFIRSVIHRDGIAQHRVRVLAPLLPIHLWRS